MIDALIAGHLHGKPAERTAKSGKPFATVKLRAATRDGEALFVSVIAFEQGVVAALRELADKDAVALAGELTVSAWLDKEGKPHPGLDLVAHQLLTPYNVGRKRKATQPAGDRLPTHTDTEVAVTAAGGAVSGPPWGLTP